MASWLIESTRRTVADDEPEVEREEEAIRGDMSEFDGAVGVFSWERSAKL